MVLARSIRLILDGLTPPEGASGLTTLITVNPPSVENDGIAESTITVQAKDFNGTNLTTGGDSVILSQNGSATLSAVTDNNDGTYTATITNTTAEETIITGTINTAPITTLPPTVTFLAQAGDLFAQAGDVIASNGVLSSLSGELVAPVSVYFEDSDAIVDSTLQNSPFHDVAYFYSFGDGSAGVWNTNGLSRNNAIGALATHVYETAGTYNVTMTAFNLSGTLYQKTMQVTVADPAVVYAGTLTKCVTTTAHADFTGAPAGCQQITEDDLSVIATGLSAGERILFARGAEWTQNTTLPWPNLYSRVTIGAFGSGNLPKVVMGTNAKFLPLSFKRFWKVMDVELENLAKDAQAINGAGDISNMLFLRLKTRGFDSSIIWSYWNEGDSLPVDQMVIQDCDLQDVNVQTIYGGGERLAVMGNLLANSDTTHVTRIWQAYKGVYSNNRVSGSSLGNSNGRHALKLHGPAEQFLEAPPPAPGNAQMANPGKFTMIFGNLFGSSGPWPVDIGPPNAVTEANLSDVIFDSNKIIAEFGLSSPNDVQISLTISARFSTARNNILDGTGVGNTFYGVAVYQRGAELPPLGVKVLNNTVYRDDNLTGNPRAGVKVFSSAIDTTVMNTSAGFNADAVNSVAVIDEGVNSTLSNNILVGKSDFVDPANIDPLLRDYHLTLGAASIDAGTPTNVFDDFDRVLRPLLTNSLGAYEYV